MPKNWTIENAKKKVEALLKAAKTERQFLKMCSNAFGYYHDAMAQALYPADDWHKHTTCRQASVRIAPRGSQAIRVDVSI